MAIIITSLLPVGLYSIEANVKEQWWLHGVTTASTQLKMLEKETERVGNAVFPRSIKNSKIRFVDVRDWTSGFFPGSLWYMYELTGNRIFAHSARKYTNELKSNQFYKGTHDLGFMMFCSYGNAIRLQPHRSDSLILIHASRSLISRFDPRVGLIRSWDFGKWKYPVIIDNMMNLEMLFWAGKVTGNRKFTKIAIEHADETMINHFRTDGSSYHVVSYNPGTGEVESKGTYQGYSDNSSWARGQAWGLYGFLVCYRETRDIKYLNQAKTIASYIMNNPKIPSDLVPYWDYDDPKIPNAPRDASAAAITASALLEMSHLVEHGDVYFKYAQTILKNLSGPEYLATPGTNSGFILKHSTGHLPVGSEIDTPINYADYYYLEALERYKKIICR